MTDANPLLWLRRLANRTLHLLARFSPTGVSTLRPWLHRLRGVNIGRGVLIGDDVYLENDHPHCIEIGDRVELGTRSMILAHLRGSGRVVIEEDVFVGPGVKIIASAGELRIGAGSVLAAATLVTSQVPERTFVRSSGSEVRHFAHVGVPLTQATTFEEFLAGLRSVKKNRHDG